MFKIKWWRVFFVVGMTVFLLPFLSYIPSAGTDADQAKLDRIIAKLERLEAACDDPELKPALQHTIARYSRIERMGVNIQSLPPCSAGCNIPWSPGLTLDRDVWDWSEDVALQILVHEAMHDLPPYIGHGHMHGVVAARGFDGRTKLDDLIVKVETDDLDKIRRMFE